MQRIFIFTFLLISFSLTAQTIQEIATGAGYAKQSFVKLSNGTETQANNDAWDIGFTVKGFQDAGIFINESGGFSMGQVLPRIELFDAGTTNFDATPVPTALAAAELLNNEVSWNYGAFNMNRNPSNFADFGWGVYNPAAMQVTGDRVYVVKLRNATYKKIQIQSLAGTTYTFRYANLDGTNAQTKTINKMEHTGKALAYFSFTTNSTVNVEPAAGFDLLYERYVTTLWDTNSTSYINYIVTGILLAPDVKAAKVLNINPETVTFNASRDTLKSTLDVIGHDWKEFSGAQWVIDPSRVYFVKTADMHLWKIEFIDFEGSSTGKAVFKKTDLGSFVSVQNPQDLGLKALVFPNPVQDILSVSLDMPTGLSSKAQLQVVDVNGRLVMDQAVQVQAGVQVLQMPASDWNAGLYHLRLLTEGKEVKLGKIVKL